MSVRLTDIEGVVHDFTFGLEPGPYQWQCEIHEEHCDLETALGMSLEECFFLSEIKSDQ